MFGDKFKIVPVYISDVTDEGRQIWVSHWDSTAKIPATVLSTLPTSLEDGRRFAGIPTPKSEVEAGDLALAAIVDERYYIIGYFNLPFSDSGKTVTAIPEKETFKPFKNGWMLKLSKLGQIVGRKTNQLVVWLGNWAYLHIKGVNIEDDSQEPTFHVKFANFIQEAFGGKISWVRKPTDERKIDWLTTYKAIYTKSHEEDVVSDVDWDPLVKNKAIDDNIGPSPTNVYDLNYIDKAIIKAGHVAEGHIYEREVRQSIEHNKEKTGFTRLREGYRDGILREFNTQNTIDSVETSERLGSNMGDDNRILDKSYIHSEGEQFTEAFGQGPDDVYKKEIIDADENYTRVQNTDKAQIITIGTSDGPQVTITAGFDGITKINSTARVVVEAPNIEIGEGADTELVRYAELKAMLDKLYSIIKLHDHNTGVGPSTPASAGVYFAAQTAILDGAEAVSGSIANLEKAIKSEITLVK